MNKLIILKGLPGSGKSTFAQELVKQGYKRVNKDLLREMIDCGVWSRDNESTILESEKVLVREFLKQGFNVVVDDCNFAHTETWMNVAQASNADFGEEFFNTPVYECIERDAKRGDKSVGSKAILNMYFKYLRKDSPWSEDKQNAFIFDIDGTLARMNGRSPYDYTKVDTDTCNQNIGMILRALRNTGLPILIVSGRKNECREMTEKWLEDNGLPHSYLFMRQDGDNRKDSIIKKEIYEYKIEPYYNIVAVFDDRNQVVDMWRSLGLTCLQCDYGGF